MSRFAALRPRRPATWRALIGGIVIGVIAVLVFGAACVSPWLLTHRSDLPGERTFGRFAVGSAARFNAGDKKNPLALNGETVQHGQSSFTGSCAYCHGPKGDGKGGALSASLFPPATDLTAGDAKEKSDAQLFWITKEGLSFTAMPGFKNQFNDDAIWALVAYMRALQGKGAAAPGPAAIPTPSSAELLKATGNSNDAQARGAALYFALNCATCHGASGNAPRPFTLRAFSPQDSVLACQIRSGPNGMVLQDSTPELFRRHLRSGGTFIQTFISVPIVPCGRKRRLQVAELFFQVGFAGLFHG